MHHSLRPSLRLLMKVVSPLFLNNVDLADILYRGNSANAKGAIELMLLIMYTAYHRESELK